ncbi:MAG: hypothetical protein HY897_14650, partial [Deltaproteobacteria bacterium]|nr:hypothetical protein [Deltaproteobacteria bacterium]
MKKTVAVFIALGLAATATGCSGDSAESLSGSAAPTGDAALGGGADQKDGGGAAAICYTDAECGAGQVCSNGQCVYTGGGYDAGYVDTYVPPEKPVYIPSPPVASKNYVYVLNAQNGTVVRINP